MSANVLFVVSNIVAVFCMCYDTLSFVVVFVDGTIKEFVLQIGLIIPLVVVEG